ALFAHELIGPVERDDRELARLLFAGPNRAVLVDADVALAERDRASTLTVHDGAVLGDELAIDAHREVAVARVARSARGVDDEEAVAVDRDIEIAARHRERAGADVKALSAIGRVDRGRQRVGKYRALRRRTRFALALVARRPDVRDVVGQTVQVIDARAQSAQCDVLAARHWVPPTRSSSAPQPYGSAHWRASGGV